MLNKQNMSIAIPLKQNNDTSKTNFEIKFGSNL